MKSDHKLLNIEIADERQTILVQIWGSNALRADYHVGGSLLIIDGWLNKKKSIALNDRYSKDSILVDSDHPRSAELLSWYQK